MTRELSRSNKMFIESPDTPCHFLPDCAQRRPLCNALVGRFLSRSVE